MQLASEIRKETCHFVGESSAVVSDEGSSDLTVACLLCNSTQELLKFGESNTPVFSVSNVRLELQIRQEFHALIRISAVVPLRVTFKKRFSAFFCGS
ncbi:hypothetical protein CDAR_191841 [Caerostris darwini]|uniref:Uncharacterized protein n=1 Tax=Caerostris darwini TaxID=1538125 RepID=A0AAV4P8C0_9ARAC|nr:hypothetical protein CDAR_191841 [Caerostris darwini]